MLSTSRGTPKRDNKFQKLLVWMADSGENSGGAYEDIRIRLIRIFEARGCLAADELADETIDRVTKKIDFLRGTYKGDPRLYFYGVAKNVFREYLRKPKTGALPFTLAQSSNRNSEKLERRDVCLAKCLDRLPKAERDFILEYYEGEKSKKIQNRRMMMEKLDLTPQALRVKAFRIRTKLQKCLFRSLG